MSDQDVRCFVSDRLCKIGESDRCVRWLCQIGESDRWVTQFCQRVVSYRGVT